MRVNVSRSLATEVGVLDVESLGSSYSHIKSLKGALGPSTKKVIAYHAFLESLEGFEDTIGVDLAYLGLNRIKKFRDVDARIPKIGVLDLVGNPLVSLKNCPPCEQLIVSATLITDLEGIPEGVEIVRCGHSTHITSLRGCPKSVKLIECSCSPNLVLDIYDLPMGLSQLLCERERIPEDWRDMVDEKGFILWNKSNPECST